MVSGEKRNCDDENPLEGTTTILLDIEGTTTSISYIKDVLFPYVRENLKNYVNEHWNDEEFKADLKALKSQAKNDEEEKIENFSPIEEGDNEKESLIKNVLWQMDLDRKTTALKQLQGHIWREGYENGTLKGHLYVDVAPALKKWSEEGRKLYIYSSGSVEAQKLLFKNSESGDLSGFITGYFDTEIGPKTEASSYSNIVNSVGCDAGQILFFTDVIKEAVAADKAGIRVMVVIREGNVPLSDDEKKAFSTISSFKDVAFESSNKKKKISEEEDVRSQCEKTENVEKMDESNEIKNGDAEKMEVETEATDAKVEDCNEENKTEENGQTKMESDSAAPETTEAEPENIDVDVDDSNAETSGGEKTVSSSGVGESENVKSDEVKEPEEQATTADGEKDENVDSTSENATGESESADKTGEHPAEEEKEKEEEEVTEEEKTTVEEAGKEEKGMNGHENNETENGDAKENDEKETTEAANGEANGKVEGMEAVPVKKVNPDEQADSTVEVKA